MTAWTKPAVKAFVTSPVIIPSWCDSSCGSRDARNGFLVGIASPQTVHKTLEASSLLRQSSRTSNAICPYRKLSSVKPNRLRTEAQYPKAKLPVGGEVRKEIYETRVLCTITNSSEHLRCSTYSMGRDHTSWLVGPCARPPMVIIRSCTRLESHTEYE